MSVSTLTLEDLLDRHEVEAPILRQASFADTNELVIEWESDGQPWFNYMEIHRWPFKEPAPEASYARPSLGASRDEMERKLLLSIEHTINHGVRYRDERSMLSTAGGVRFFLGRDYAPGDQVVVHLLRQPKWMEWQQPGGSVDHDLICEFSVQVTPG